MKKPTPLRFLGSLLLADLAALMAYICLLMLLNVFTEGKLVMSTGALASRGWDAEDVAPAMRVFLTIAEVVLGVVAMGAVYAVLQLRLCRDAGERDAFLAELGTAPYDRAAWRVTYMRRRGWRSVGCLTGLVLVCLCAEALGVPFASLPIVPLTLFPHSLVNLLPIGMSARRIMIGILSILLNFGVSWAYHRHIAPRAYDRLAGERLRVEA